MPNEGPSPPAVRPAGELLSAAQWALRGECERYEHHAALSLVVAAAAHHVSSPLNAILLNAERARALAAEYGDDVVGVLNKVMSEVERCGAATRSLTRVVVEPEHQPTPQAVAGLVREGCALASPELDHAGTDLTLGMPQDLPALHLDRVAMHAALFLLLRDAAERGASVITVRGERAEREVRVSVHDDGMPLPEALLQRICNPFRAEDPRMAGFVTTTGVVRRALERHGGAMQASSHAGAGTRFELTLPA